MEYPLISVIVPVYNVEKYLQRCVDSLLNQTYPNIEIILVNDGSTDNSWAICKKNADLYSTILAISKPNGGLSSARNAGLELAKGQFIGFIDSDDWIEPDMYAYLYTLIISHKADVAQIKYELAYDNQHKIPLKNERIEVLNGCDNILEYYMEQTTVTGDYSVCICLFDSSIAKKYRFREGKTCEDMDYKFNILSKCSCFVSSNQAKYHYFQSGNSISSGLLASKDFQLYESANLLCRLCASRPNKRTQFLGEVKKARSAFSLLSKGAFYGIADNIDNNTIQKLVKEHRANLPILLKAPMALSRKIAAIAFAINYKRAKDLILLYKNFSSGKI